MRRLLFSVGTIAAVCGCDIFLEDLIEWKSITGGSFMMGAEDPWPAWERPVHQVNVPAFEITRTEVTVKQYQLCVNSGKCSEPDDYQSTGNPWCEWENTLDEDITSVNCVDWDQAVDFCTWAHARLPSEAEWEYAARNQGQDVTNPWGEEPASCEYAALMEEDGVGGCTTGRNLKTCSKPAGNTEQGLCDMVGSLWEWVQDYYHNDYNGAPTDGSAWEQPATSMRSRRSGGWGNPAAEMHAAMRGGTDPSERIEFIGIRCVR